MSPSASSLRPACCPPARAPARCRAHPSRRSGDFARGGSLPPQDKHRFAMFAPSDRRHAPTNQARPVPLRHQPGVGGCGSTGHSCRQRSCIATTGMPRRSRVHGPVATDSNRCVPVIRTTAAAMRHEAGEPLSASWAAASRLLKRAQRRRRPSPRHLAGAAHGSTTVIPRLSKSPTFRAANFAPHCNAMAAICASNCERGTRVRGFGFKTVFSCSAVRLGR